VTDNPLIEAIDRLRNSVDGLVIEVKTMHTHGASAGYFLQCAVEDLQETVNELKGVVQR
jgi:hypothetical protein